MTTHVDHMQMAEDIFRLAALERLGLKITPEAFHASSPSISLTSEEDGKYYGEISVSNKSAFVSAKFWLVEVGLLVHASACLTEYLDHVNKQQHKLHNPWAHAWYAVSTYTINCDCN